MKSKVGYFLTLWACLLLAACSGEVRESGDAKNASETPSLLQQRSEARWRALIRRDFATAYPFYTPGYRSTKSLLQFVDNFPGGRVVWSDVEYVEEDCEAAKCKVRLNVTYSLLNPAPGVNVIENTRPVDEIWLLIDGNWYFSP